MLLTRSHYEALCRYRDSVIPVPPEGLSPADQWLFDHKLIMAASMQVERYNTPIKVINFFADAYTISEEGRKALEEYESEKRRSRNRILLDIAIGVLCALLGALFARILGG